MGCGVCRPKFALPERALCEGFVHTSGRTALPQSASRRLSQCFTRVMDFKEACAQQVKQGYEHIIYIERRTWNSLVSE
eukprot:725716-Amphidinium_carterae.1